VGRCLVVSRLGWSHGPPVLPWFSLFWVPFLVSSVRLASSFFPVGPGSGLFFSFSFFSLRLWLCSLLVRAFELVSRLFAACLVVFSRVELVLCCSPHVWFIVGHYQFWAPYFSAMSSICYNCFSLAFNSSVYHFEITGACGACSLFKNVVLDFPSILSLPTCSWMSSPTSPMFFLHNSYFSIAVTNFELVERVRLWLSRSLGFLRHHPASTDIFPVALTWQVAILSRFTGCAYVLRSCSLTISSLYWWC